MKKIVIIGGGIAGLASAYYLCKQMAADELPARITVIDPEGHWGGKITTIRESGFVIEGGPDTFLATKPWGVGVCKELGIEDRLQGTNPKQRSTYVLHEGSLKSLPDGLAMMIPTNFGSMAASRLLNWPQKIRMGLDFLIPPRPQNGDESLGEFISRRLGRGAYENLIEPLMSGIYAGGGDKLSLKSTFPYLHDLEQKHGGLVKGALVMKQKAAKAGRSTQGSRSAFLTPKTGLAEIVETITAYLEREGVDLRLHTRAVHLVQTEDGYQIELENGSALQADAVILAAPAYASGSLVESINPALAGVLQSIPYVSTATVSMAFHKSELPHDLNGYGYVIPRREGRRALACTWTSTKFPHRAPDDFALVRVFVGRAGQDIPWNQADMLSLAKEELELTLGITAEPVLSRVFLWEKAMPQYNLGHPKLLSLIYAEMEKYPALALAGNGYRGIGIPDCIHSGEIAAQKISQTLKNAQPAPQVLNFTPA